MIHDTYMIRDIYPKALVRGMIVRWHPCQFPANRKPRWLCITEVQPGTMTYADRVWIAWSTVNENGDPVDGGRWVFDTTPMQEKVLL
jgi:hypothetical protein